jgi:plastocyanin
MQISLARNAIALACVLTAVACGSKNHEPQTYRVTIRSMQFEPASIEVAVGDVVVWTNEDIVPHTVTAAGAFDSQSLTTDQEWHYTTTQVGEYPYGCTFHPTMKATLIVR